MITTFSLLIVGVVYAASVYYTSSNHVTGTPLDPVDPPEETDIYSAELTANNTDVDVYKGDFLQLTATLNATVSGIEVCFYQNSYLVANTTSIDGVATCTKQVFDPYDFYVTVKTIIT